MSSFQKSVAAVAAAFFLLLVIAAPASGGSQGTLLSGTVSLSEADIEPSGATVVTAEVTSAGEDDAVIVIELVPQAGAVGSFALSDIQESVDGFMCFIDDQLVECLWNDPAKGPGDTATVSFTATSSSDADGEFAAVLRDETLAPVELDTTPVTVGTPETTTTTTTSPEAPTTQAPAAQPVQASPTFTG